MNKQDYQKLLAYLKNPSEVEEKYKVWASQFKEKYNHIYRGEQKVVSKEEVEWIMFMFHDDLTKAHQNTDTMYQQISKRYFWQNMRQEIKDFAKTCYKGNQLSKIIKNV